MDGTRQLCETLAKLKRRPSVLVSASAIGYYGNRGTEPLSEDSSTGAGFLAKVCRDWEAATLLAAEAGIRVVNLRFGIVLSSDGGALAKMLLPFRMGVGGIVGDGRQFWSWVAIEDVVGAIQHALFTEGLRGPVNVVSPNSVTNQEFTKTLGRVLGRPTIFPLPGSGGASGFWRNGGCLAARRRAGAADLSGGQRLSVLLPKSRNRATPSGVGINGEKLRVSVRFMRL